MGLTTLLLLTVFTLSYVRLSASIVPDPPCLLHRQECEFRHDDTPMPVDNEYGIYSTRIRQFTPGELDCIIRRRNNQVKTILTNGGDPLVKYIFSPGLELEASVEYGNQALVTYNVSCPDNHFAYFELLSLELEEPSCVDPTVADSVAKCVDYLRVTPLGFGSIEVCGTDGSPLEQAQLFSGTLEILFRTSDNMRFPGFSAAIICVDQTPAAPVGKRSTEAASAFEVEFDRAVDYIRRITYYYQRIGYYSYYRRYFPHLFRLEEVIIEFGHSFEYINNKLTITQGDNIVNFDDVQVVKILNGQGEVTVFRRNAKDFSGQPLTINGPGTLTIVGCSAFYTNFVVNPKGILPLSAEERDIVRTLTSGHFERNILELREEKLCPELLDPPSFADESVLLTDDPIDDDGSTVPECRRPVMTANSTCDWSDDSVLLALANFNAPNVVVRTISRVAVNCTRVFQPGRIEALLADPLSVDCVIDKLPDSEYSVRCVDNREGSIWFESCSVVDLDTGDYTSLNSFCSYPSLRFPLTLLSPGRKQLVLVAKDSSDTRVTKRINFSVGFFVNCTSLLTGTSVFPQVEVMCRSNLPALSIGTCQIDGRPELFTGCAFPEFVIEPLRLGLSPGSHYVQMSFVDRIFGTITLTLSFSF